VLDGFLQIAALHHVLRAAGLARDNLESGFDLGGPSAARPHLRIGMKPEQPLVEIDLAEPAAHAARQLAAALGFAAGDRERR
jgi:hypothetical protein